MLIKLLFAVMAIGSLLWSMGFVRAAIATFRRGVPFHVSGHRQGAMPVGAAFGRIGAALITGVILMITYMMVRMALAVWAE